MIALVPSRFVAVPLVVLTLGLTTCAQDAGPEKPLETTTFALEQCTFNQDCWPAPPCKQGLCADGECRYVNAVPNCCVEDADCDPNNDCQLGSCFIFDDAETGMCQFSPDPEKPECCNYSFDCDLPPPGYLAQCQFFEQLGYKTCNYVEDPDVCWPPMDSILINEFMADPGAANDSTGEWIELFNQSLSPVDINGWTLEDADADSFALVSAAPILVPPGGYFLLARSDNQGNNGGLQPDFIYYNFTLSNGSDEIILRDFSGLEVDRVEYGFANFTTTNGASLELASPYMDNNDPFSWKTAVSVAPPYQDKGTPGAPNTDTFFFYFTPMVCNDSNSCTLDTCGDGGEPRCRHEPIQECCLFAVECSDGDVCTVDSCKPESLSCLHQPVAECCNGNNDCNDGSDCTIDHCVNHKCRNVVSQETPGCCLEDQDCTDTNPCTIDFCTQDPGTPYKTCHYNSPGGTTCCYLDHECDDDMPETVDSCSDYKCEHITNPEFCMGPPPQFCDDEDPCTKDTCNMVTNLCSHEIKSDCCVEDPDCDDGDGCTTDICLGAVHLCDHIWNDWCCHSAVDCEPFLTDQDICKEPICVNFECRMQHLPNENCCLTNKDCADGDACTDDVCNPGNNTCSHIPEGKGCCNTTAECAEDDDPCTKVTCIADQCITQVLEGCCKGDWECEDADPCTVDKCVNYLCRFHKDADSLCCNQDLDCPPAGPLCVEATCSPAHVCKYDVVADCTVKTDWYESFSGVYELDQAGWTLQESPVGLWTVSAGEGALGPDRCVALAANTSILGGTTCLVSPAIEVVNAGVDHTLTFEQNFLADLALTAGQVTLTVELRPVGVGESLPLAQFGSAPLEESSPFMVGVGKKMLSSPFKLAFCAQLPQGLPELSWSIDSVRLGMGQPPRILTNLPDLFLLPDADLTVPVQVSDPDGPHMAVHLSGPSHTTLKNLDKSLNPVQLDLVFGPAGEIDLGSYLVTLRVSDGFFADHRTFTETIYIPKCDNDIDCDDQQVCTEDICDPVEGCQYETLDGCCDDDFPCNDADACTQDVCIDHACQFEGKDCNDDNICTDDMCDPAVGCTHPFNIEPCEDDNICTWHDGCYQGQCVGLPVDCADSLACTLDSCVPSEGCLHKSLCSDSILCTTDVCTPKGCKSGKAPVGSPIVDGIVDEQWPESSVAGGGANDLGSVYMLVDQANLYLAIDGQPQPYEAAVIYIDKDFTAGSGAAQMQQLQVGDLELGPYVAPDLEVDFPGFGADLAFVVQWSEDPAFGAQALGCFLLSAGGELTEFPCTLAPGVDGDVELAISWTTLYGDDELLGKLAAIVVATVSVEGQLLDTIPDQIGGVVGDVVVFGIPDPMCLVSFCGDGVVDEGEECDDAAENSDVVANACRQNCKWPWCGDEVIDDGESCDHGDQNSNNTPDACRGDCTLPFCGDNVIDSEEECDNGEENNNDIPDACRTDCLNPWCGDEVVDGFEQCDTGPEISDDVPDACRSTCLWAWCGDDVIDEGETCDDGENNSDENADACRTSCLPAYCGDMVIDSDEECDNGPDNNDELPGACRTSCLQAHCGDGVLDDGEQCDDGNQEDWDGCQADCVIYFTECGDGLKTPDEECDEGDQNNDEIPNACRTNCMWAYCGDGIIDDGEQCDDGNMQGGDECGLDCTPYVAFCGNGWIDEGEQCDNGDDNSNTAPDACREDCELPFCGDMIVDTDEECDKGIKNNDELPNACRTTCLFAHCGDNVIDSGEQCDDGPDNADAPDHCKTDCIAPICGDLVVDMLLGEQCDWGQENSNQAPDSCRENCLFWFCGDGVIDVGETCDEGEDNSDETPDACRTSCQPASCGDLILDSGEECDHGANNSDANPDACREDCTEASCGDETVDPGNDEECDWGGNNSDEDPDACRENCLFASCGDLVIDSGEECDDGNDILGDGCAPDCSIETYVPDPGDIIISEIMQNPAKVYDTMGEYLELYNTRDFDIDINGWEITDDGMDYHEIEHDGPLLVPALGYLVLGNEASPDFNGGVDIDYQYDNILLGNAVDEITVAYKGAISDDVHYDGGPGFPDPKGASMNLDPNEYDYIANDDGSNWCASTTLLPEGDKGTPGFVNIHCN